jgi:hypothetical protein
VLLGRSAQLGWLEAVSGLSQRYSVVVGPHSSAQSMTRKDARDDLRDALLSAKRLVEER